MLSKRKSQYQPVYDFDAEYVQPQDTMAGSQKSKRAKRRGMSSCLTLTH